MLQSLLAVFNYFSHSLHRHFFEDANKLFIYPIYTSYEEVLHV